MGSNKKHTFLCVRKTQPAIRKSVFKLIIDLISEWKINSLCEINKTNMVISFLNGSSIMCIGMDDPEKLKSITGITSAFIEEATEISAEDAQQISLRIRGVTDSYKQIIYCFNPISRLNWIYKRFFVKDDDITVTTHHSNYKSNRFLDEEYIVMLEDLVNQNKTAFDIYTRGAWGVLDSIIFDNYKTVKRLPTEGETVIGIDFGYNAPSGIVKIVCHDNQFYIDELLYQTKLTNTDLIGKMKQLNIKQYPIVADSAEPQRIEEIRRAGFNIRGADKKSNSVKDGIDYIKSQKLFITEASDNLLKELSGYVYKKDRDNNVLDEPTKWNDHLIDSARYGLFTYFANKIDYNIIT